jgi:hypothetical protein
MEYTTRRIEVSRGIVREQEARIAQQRRKVMQFLADRNPADELQARLLIMEQSLIAMTRFLRMLERDIQDEFGLHQHQIRKRIEDRRQAVRTETVAEAADRFASQARDSILAPDETVESLDRLARAMRPLAGQ